MALCRRAAGALVQVWICYEFPAPGLEPAWPWHIVGSDGILELDPYHSVSPARGSLSVVGGGRQVWVDMCRAVGRATTGRRE